MAQGPDECHGDRTAVRKKAALLCGRALRYLRLFRTASAITRIMKQSRPRLNGCQLFGGRWRAAHVRFGVYSGPKSDTARCPSGVPNRTHPPQPRVYSVNFVSSGEHLLGLYSNSYPRYGLSLGWIASWLTQSMPPKRMRMRSSLPPSASSSLGSGCFCG